MKLTSGGFGVLARSVANIADCCCSGRVVFALEGGYNLGVLRSSVKAVLKELADLTRSSPEEKAEDAKRKKIDYVLKRCRHVHRNFWKCL
jgi:acetoin utilization deacetylase AcuC-like enzyme